MSQQEPENPFWIPDNPDGSGWADVDWVSATRGSRYHYRHGLPLEEARAQLPPYYQVVTRSETDAIPTPHENTYYVPQAQLADFLSELVWSGGAETVWHIEPCQEPPVEARVK